MQHHIHECLQELTRRGEEMLREHCMELHSMRNSNADKASSLDAEVNRLKDRGFEAQKVG